MIENFELNRCSSFNIKLFFYWQRASHIERMKFLCFVFLLFFLDSYLILGNYSLGFPSTNKFTHLVSSGSIATIMRFVAEEVLIADSTKLTKIDRWRKVCNITDDDNDGDGDWTYNCVSTPIRKLSIV
uniref:Uncharacterized protein n=1 Tax=Glossina pallidipes TaxID=7398 RepID=A0A1A9ZTY3_GLOPL